MNKYQQIIGFLAELRENNTKEWFDANRKRYKEIRLLFEEFVSKLIRDISSFDPEIENITVKQSTYRINKDIRFSKDKTPYKTHMGAYIVRGGKKSGYCGYYVHLEPEGELSTNYFPFGGSMLSAGLYMPEPKVLYSVREEILCNGEEIRKLIDEAKTRNFILGVDSDTLKRTPKGFPADSPYDDLLRLKHFHIDKSINQDYLYSGNLSKKIAVDFESTAKLVALINKAVQFAFDEM